MYFTRARITLDVARQHQQHLNDWSAVSRWHHYDSLLALMRDVVDTSYLGGRKEANKSCQSTITTDGTKH